MEIDQQTIDKCIKQAEAIIGHYCNLKAIPAQDREEFYSEGMLGMSVALERKRSGKANKSEFAVNTYTNSFVRGYMMSLHTILYEKRKDHWWYKLHHPKKNDISKYHKHPKVAVKSCEDQVVARDLINKSWPLLTDKMRRVVYLRHYLGYTGPETVGFLEDVTTHYSVASRLSGPDGAYGTIRKHEKMGFKRKLTKLELLLRRVENLNGTQKAFISKLSPRRLQVFNLAKQGYNAIQIKKTLEMSNGAFHDHRVKMERMLGKMEAN